MAAMPASSRVPSAVAPMLASPGRGRLPDNPRFAYEYKYDGYRAVLRVSAAGDVVLTSRNDKDITAEFAELAGGLGDALGGRAAVLDGELVVRNELGQPEFALMQERRGRYQQRLPIAELPVAYLVFDLLRLGDEDLTGEPYLNHFATIHPVLAEAAGYYYGLAHFLVTSLVLAWLYLRRPTEFAGLRSGLVLATAAANVVFWVWPAAPPRFSVPRMTDILVTRDILGAAHPHGATSLVNLYAAMPSLHVAWAAWCALAVIAASRSRWRHLAWLYPAATTLVVLASANHFVLDAAGGLGLHHPRIQDQLHPRHDPGYRRGAFRRPRAQCRPPRRHGGSPRHRFGSR